jgi:hypothetical protein
VMKIDRYACVRYATEVNKIQWHGNTDSWKTQCTGAASNKRCVSRACARSIRRIGIKAFCCAECSARSASQRVPRRCPNASPKVVQNSSYIYLSRRSGAARPIACKTASTPLDVVSPARPCSSSPQRDMKSPL